MRLLGHRFGQQAALVKTDIARRRADQAAHRMALHVLAHIEANQVNAHDVGQLLGRFGLANTRGAGKQERANRLVAFAQAGARHLDGRSQHVQRLVLTEHHALEVALQCLEFAAVVVRDIGGRNARDLGDDFLDLGFGDGLLALGHRQDALSGTGLVDHVNRFVGQMPVVDVLGAQFGGRLQGSHGVLHAMVLFKARFQALENLNGFLHRGLDHINFLKAPRQGSVFFENAPVFGESGRADALELTRTERRLEQIRRIQRAARGSAGTDQGVDFVNEQDAIRLVFKRLENALETLLEITAVLGACQQGAHVQ